MKKSSSKVRLRRINESWQADEAIVTLKRQYQLQSSNEDQNIKNFLGLFDFQYDANIIIVGVQDFRKIFEVYSRLTPNSTLLLIELQFEDEFVIDGQISSFNDLINDNRVRILIGSTDKIEESLYSVFRTNEFVYNMKNTKVISMPYLKSQYPAEVSKVFNSIFENMHTVLKGFGNSIEDTLIGIDNFVNNWRQYAEGVHATFFENQMKKTPCIIVGAGPSLDKNVHLLKGAQPHALIIAVDAALNTLLKHEIVPDVVATIERSEKTFKFYKNYNYFDSIVFLGPSIIRGEVIQKFKHCIFTGRVEDEFLRSLTEWLGYKNINIGFNVAHLPYAFARLLECDPIVFVGLDLAYTEGKTHSFDVAHTIEGDNAYVLDDNMIKVKGQNGEVLNTFNYFLYAQKLFETLILADKSRLTINATEGGVNIVGTKNLLLQDVIDDLKKVEPLKRRIIDIYQEIHDGQEHDFIRMTLRAREYFAMFRKSCEDLKELTRQNREQLMSLNGEALILFIRKNRQLNIEDERTFHINAFIMQSVIIAYNRRLKEYPFHPNDTQLQNMRDDTEKFYLEVSAISNNILESIDAYITMLNLYLKESEYSDG